MPKKPSGQDVLAFWFTEIPPEFWFKKDAEFDARIADQFEGIVKDALAGRCDHWANDSAGCLALILVLDQFTRNIFRGSARAFSGDDMALALSLRCVERDYIAHPDENWRRFMLMPMMHSEDLAIQEASLPLFQTQTSKLIYDYAVAHRDIIARFGRFPHRNAILGRPSNEEEQLFLTQPGSSF
jgi:uncharacterized protein (DUF924 family)